MKRFVPHIFLTVALLVITLLACNAQEAGSPSFESYNHIPGDRFNASSDDEPPAFQTKKDSIVAQGQLKRNVYKPSPVVPKEKKPEESSDNSVLSFNFLYYLIQKYKMQDIVD